MKKIILLALGLLLSAHASATTHTLAGDIVEAGMFFTEDVGYGVGRIRRAGLERPFMVFEGNRDAKVYGESFTLDVNGDHFYIDFRSDGRWAPGVTFALAYLDFSDMAPNQTWGLDVDTNLQGYTLELRPHAVIIGLGGTDFTSSTYFKGTFNVAPVPEPSTWALMGFGLGGVALLRRRTGKARSA